MSNPQELFGPQGLLAEEWLNLLEFGRPAFGTVQDRANAILEAATMYHNAGRITDQQHAGWVKRIGEYLAKANQARETPAS